MRAAVFQKGGFQIENLPPPTGTGQMLVRPLVCGICGSDFTPGITRSISRICCTGLASGVS